MMKVNPYHVINLSPLEDFPCLSIYANTEQQLASLIGKAEEMGREKYNPQTLDTIFKPIHRFLKNFHAEKNKNPIALFSTKHFAGFSRLPFETKPLTVVANSFHVKPLLKWMQREQPFSLLKLNDKGADLYQGSLSHFEQIERLSYRQLRTMDGVFNALDRAVYRSLQSAKVPLVIAGEYDLVDAYKNVSGYKIIVDDSIIDPFVYEKNSRLHAAAIKVLEPYLEQKELALLNSYWAAERRGLTSTNLQEIVRLSLLGSVRHLFVSEKVHVWGKIDFQNASFSYSSQQTSPEDDVLDDLAEIVLKKHGTVTVLPSQKMPNGNAACAILNRRTNLERSAMVSRKLDRELVQQAAS